MWLFETAPFQLYRALLEICQKDGAFVQQSHIFGNLLIAVAYFSIPMSLGYIMSKRNLEFKYIFGLFVAFILLCGTGHLIEVVILAYPMLRLQAAVMWLTGFVSIAAAIVVWKAIPLVIAMPTVAQMKKLVVERDKAIERLGANEIKLAEDRDLLIRELNHRVRNNLQIIEGTIMAQLRSIKDITCRAQITDTLGRIKAISRVHDQIYGNDNPNALDTAIFLDKICVELGQHFGAEVTTEIDSLMVTVDDAVPMAQIVNELLTNAIKYGKSEDGTTRIMVSLSPSDDGWNLMVTDHGRGFSADVMPSKPKSLGMRMIKALATQLGGALIVDSVPGRTTFAVKGFTPQLQS